MKVFLKKINKQKITQSEIIVNMLMFENFLRGHLSGRWVQCLACFTGKGHKQFYVMLGGKIPLLWHRERTIFLPTTVCCDCWDQFWYPQLKGYSGLNLCMGGQFLPMGTIGNCLRRQKPKILDMKEIVCDRSDRS